MEAKMSKKIGDYPIDKDFEKWAKFQPPLNKVSVFLSQKVMNLLYFNEKSDENVEVKRFKIPYGVDKKQNAIIYMPKNIDSKNVPCLVYFHGGGFVMPAAPHHYHNARKYAKEVGCIVIFVNYPLAPKNKYPIPAEACFDAYKWVLDNACKFNIDTQKIAIGGDSAGGTLASVAILKAFDNKLPLPCAQMLIYPAPGSATETESMKTFVDTPLCNSVDYKKYCKYYFNSEQDMKERYVSPLKAEDLSIFPPTYIETAEFDCLRDEALEFGELLNKAGVKTTINKTERTMHGYDMVEDSKITLASMAKRIEFLKENLIKKEGKVVSKSSKSTKTKITKSKEESKKKSKPSPKSKIEK